MKLSIGNANSSKRTLPSSAIGSFISGTFISLLLVAVILLFFPVLIWFLLIAMSDFGTIHAVQKSMIGFAFRFLVEILFYLTPIIQLILLLFLSIVVARSISWKGRYFVAGFLLLMIPAIILSVAVMIWGLIDGEYMLLGPIEAFGIF